MAVDSENESQILRFKIKDTGVGIPEDKQALIFSPFTQGDTSTTRMYGGTGLGLTISALLATMMGGKIWLESAVGCGTAFFFTAEFGIVQKQPPDPNSCLNLSDRRVLLVEGNELGRQILSRMLWPTKAQVVCVGGMPTALERLAMAQAEGVPYHVLVADTDLGSMDSTALVARLRSFHTQDNLSIILLCSAGRKPPILHNDIHFIAIAKPVQRRDLLTAISKSSSVAEHPGKLLEATVALQPPKSAIALKILLAEDNRVNQTVAKRLLEKRGHTVTVASDGLEAVSLVEENEFDLVLMDIQMPEMDGIAATGQIRRMQSSTDRHTPTIAMTAHAMKGDRERYLTAGMDGYVSKPFNGVDLDRAISSLLTETAPR